MTSSFLWTTIHVLLWNYVIYTSEGIAPHGPEDKSIDLHRQQRYATHNNKRQVKDTKPIINDKFDEPSPITGVDHMGNPFLRLPPSKSPVGVKKPLSPSGNRDKSKPKNNDSAKSNRLGNTSEKNMLKTPQESLYLSLSTTFPDISYNEGNINNAQNNYENAHLSSDDPFPISDANLFSSLSNKHGISPFMQPDNVSPQLILKSSNPSEFSNEQLSNAVINNEPSNDNAPKPIQFLEQSLWNEQMHPSFYDFSMPTPQYTKFPENKPFVHTNPTDKNLYTSPSKIIDNDENESLKFLQQLPQPINPKFVYQKESIFENKMPLFSTPVRFMAPSNTPYGEQMQSDWPNQVTQASDIKSQSIPPTISLLYGQRHSMTDSSVLPKFTETDAITSTSSPISTENKDSTSRLDEQQQQVTTLPESSQFADSPSITSTFKPSSMEKVESTSLPDEQQQITDLPESSESTESPSTTSITKPTATDEKESTSPSYEQQQTTVTNLSESSELTETTSFSSITPKPTLTEKEKSTSPPHEKQPLPLPLPLPAELVKTPAITTEPTPISLEKKPSMFMPHEQSLINWQSPSQFINTLGSISPPFSAQDDITIASPGVIPYYKNEQQQFLTNAPQFIPPGENFKYHNDAYQKFLQQSLYSFQPVQNFIPLTRLKQNQVSLTAPHFSQPPDTLLEYYAHMFNENLEHCFDK